MAIKESWLEELRRDLGSETELVGTGAKVPEHWEGYLSESAGEREITVRHELEKIANYFPVDDLKRPAIWDTFKSRAPDALVWVHENIMDGLTNTYLAGGFVSSMHMRTMADLRGLYAEQSWHAAYVEDHDPANVVQLLSSGGGGYLLIDLNVDLSVQFEPKALFVDVGAPPEEGKQQVNLFPYLDEWMAIALAEADIE